MFPYIVIITLSLINNWGVQLGYYIYRKAKDPDAFWGQRTLLQYYTGYIGDVIIVPLINILIYYFMVNIGYKPRLFELVGAYGAALVLDFFTHFYQGKTKMTNWSMPRPFRWNFAGYWHMISFPIQISYLLLFLWLLVHNGMRVLSDGKLVATTIGVIALMWMFLILYRIDNPKNQTLSNSLR